MWIINVYLTDEQLDLTRHLRRRTEDLRSLYSDRLKPNQNLESEIQAQQRYQNSHIIIEGSTKHSKSHKGSPGGVVRGVSKESSKVNKPFRPSDEDSFVTISYGSDSVSFTKKKHVNPLKRSKVHGKRSLGEVEGRSIFDPLPPLPPNKSPRERPLPSPPDSYSKGRKPDNETVINPYDTLKTDIDDQTPPIPSRSYDLLEDDQTPPIPPRSFIALEDDQTPPILPKTYDVEESLPPVPIRGRPVDQLAPKPPPRKGDQPPVPPPRSSRSSSREPPRPPSPPPREGSVKIPANTEIKASTENGGRNEDNPLSPTSEFGTPKSSLDVFIRSEMTSNEEGSDQSEGYRTPPPFSSRNLLESSGSLYSHSHNSFFTPFKDSSKDEMDTLENNSAKQLDDVENHYEFDDDSRITDGNITMRSDGSGSLIITKAVSEFGSNNELDETGEEEEEEEPDGVVTSTPHVVFDSVQSTETGLEDSIVTEDPSPVPPELMESVSEGDDEIGNARRQSFVPTTLRQRDPKLGTLAQQRAKTVSTRELGSLQGHIQYNRRPSSGIKFGFGQKV